MSVRGLCARSLCNVSTWKDEVMPRSCLDRHSQDRDMPERRFMCNILTCKDLVMSSAPVGRSFMKLIPIWGTMTCTLLILKCEVSTWALSVTYFLWWLSTERPSVCTQLNWKDQVMTRAPGAQIFLDWHLKENHFIQNLRARKDDAQCFNQTFVLFVIDKHTRDSSHVIPGPWKMMRSALTQVLLLTTDTCQS